MLPLETKNLVRGQFRGYRQEPGVAPGSQTETFAALKLEIDSWRWHGVPIYIRAGKNLPLTRTEIIIRLLKPPSMFRAFDLKTNYFRFALSPEIGIALGINVMASGAEGVAESVEITGSRQPCALDMDAYERVLTDALAGDPTLFARHDYIEEAWRIVDPALKAESPVFEYDPNTWGPKEVAQVTPPGGWHNPMAKLQRS